MEQNEPASQKQKKHRKRKKRKGSPLFPVDLHLASSPFLVLHKSGERKTVANRLDGWVNQ